jgi:serine/threonine protein kinase/CheY-like chemotaxis protein
MDSPNTIPDKQFFKLGEVCDITGVQAHVLRYWESEFPMLAPQKNRAGQRTYRKRDVEIVLRIKELLYEDQYTIAGAKKKLVSELSTKTVSRPRFSPEPLKILFADADSQITQAVQEYMERAGKKVFIAENGREALSGVREHQPDVIILETRLSEIDGLSVCRQLKADELTKQTPIIFLSANDDIVDKVIGLEMGATDYITKPFSLRELEARISAVLRNRPVKSLKDQEETAITKPLEAVKPDPFRRSGTVLNGKYELTEFAGSGGMGAVYRSLSLADRTVVAVKILQPHILARNPEYAVLFEREVKNAQSLDHPHIVNVFDSGRDDDLSYMVMEWIEGSSIEDVITQGQLSIERLTNIFKQVCEAVAAAHDRSIIHLDIKPANILLLESAKPNDFIKVIDFGLSRVITRESGTTVTKFRGTDKYCAPEQFGGRVSHRSDIYSLGATLYHLITGVIPFGMSYVNAKMHPNLELPAIPPVNRQRDVPSGVNQVIDKALNRDPDLRQQSAKQLYEEFIEAISEVSAQKTTHPDEAICQTEKLRTLSELKLTRLESDVPVNELRLEAIVNHVPVRGYEGFMEHSLIVGLINNSAKRVTDFRVEVELPDAFTNQSTTYMAEVRERRTPTSRYFRAESKDRPTKTLYPGDRVREFFKIDLIIPPVSKRDEILEQKITVKVFAGDDMTHEVMKSVRSVLEQAPSFG